MSIIETQIRTDRFCELVKSELNSRLLPSPSLDKPPIIQVQQLEKIECVSCSLDAPSNGSGTVVVGSAASPSAARSRRTAWGSVTAPRSRPPQRSHTSTSNPNTRWSNRAQVTGSVHHAPAVDG
jgi:hypothetical protein